MGVAGASLNRLILLVVACVLAFLGGCVTGRTVVHEGPLGAVYLEGLGKDSLGAAHPTTLGVPTLERVLTGIHVQPDARMLRESISAIAGVQRVETVDEQDGRVRIRAFPKKGGTIGTQIAELIRDRELRIHELFVEQGSLDDMFWKITEAGDGGAEGNA